MKQVVCKFGGTSVSTRQTWENIAAITTQHIKDGKQPVIVCSALSQISNKLEQAIDAALLGQQHQLENQIKEDYLQLSKKLELEESLIAADLQQLHQWLNGISLLKEASPKIHAQILSLGELMLTRLGHAFLQIKAIDCLWFDAREALVSMPVPGGDAINYLAAYCPSEENPKLQHTFNTSKAQAIITQGFIAANAYGETVLLGRGGSDVSAALLAANLNAKLCEIWTDVPGICTANPHVLPHARLLKQLSYDEAQEIASMGAKVLHPNCIPPVRKANIPMAVRFTRMPQHSGTKITQDSDSNAPPIKSIQVKHNIVLISINTLAMWRQVGFLADVFSAFKRHDFSVDLLSSSEFNVTLSLDCDSKLHSRQALKKLLADLNCFGQAKLIDTCSAVSLVGRPIRTVLPQLGPVLAIFEAQQIYLMSLASNDLNLTFVVAENQADKLCQKLHALLIENNPQSFYYSKSWHEEFGMPEKPRKAWWEEQHKKLLTFAENHSPCYVYNLRTLQQNTEKLLTLSPIDKFFYAIKANPHPTILQKLHPLGIGFECVSLEELKHILAIFPSIDRKNILFTPNFAPKNEYEFAAKLGCSITVDNLYILQHWTDLFRNRSILLRIDPGSGMGHHKHVCTGGSESKFGISQNDLATAARLVQENTIEVIGLHAHSGSGILNVELWSKTASLLISLSRKFFPNATILNLGGGLGIAEKPGQNPLELNELKETLSAIKTEFPQFSFWLEPGRFFVAECGVLLAKVTQLKEKMDVHFVGIQTGMNSLIRPALYNAYHEIVNLSRLNTEKKALVHVVGPICESGDTFGYDRLFPITYEEDVVLIANTGAYGYSMSSNYNLRPPANEIILD